MLLQVSFDFCNGLVKAQIKELHWECAILLQRIFLLSLKHQFGFYKIQVNFFFIANVCGFYEPWVTFLKVTIFMRLFDCKEVQASIWKLYFRVLSFSILQKKAYEIHCPMSFHLMNLHYIFLYVWSWKANSQNIIVVPTLTICA
jgi:hypothetical protein